MAIKNYTSDKPLEKIFAELQQTLAAHGAKQISYDYGDDGNSPRHNILDSGGE